MNYAELHVRSCYSFLEGASSPVELLETALALGLPAMALTDRNGLYGIVEAREDLLRLCGLARRDDEPRTKLKLLYGSELDFGDDVAVALVQNRRGYAQLSSAITRGRLAAPKGEFRLGESDLLAHAEGLFLLAGGPRSASMGLLCAGAHREAGARLMRLREAFGERLHVELTRHLAPGDVERSQAMAALARELGIPIVATGDVRFHAPERKPVHDLLTCIRGGFTLDEAGRRLLPNAEAHLKSARSMAQLFSDLPEAIAHTTAIADAIDFRLCDIRYSYPPPDLPLGETADSLLAHLCRTGLIKRLGDRAPRYAAQLEKELDLIRELDYAGYFLTMWEIVQTCQQKKILCQGRGSAANSLACYALEITSVPPDTIDMLFERFISKERNEPPDIDLDIEHERREEIIQHVYSKYGRDHAGMVAEVIRYRHRSALQDAGKALGFAEQELALLWKSGEGAAQRVHHPNNSRLKLLLMFCQTMNGLPRHLSIHVGGFILSGQPLSQIVPIENGRMEDRTVIQWSKDDVDAMGMFKLDLLGLGMLTVLAKAFALIPPAQSLTLHNIPPEDKPTYEMICTADTIGVFQIESRAQMNMLPRLLPKTFYDLVIEVAIVRPGPIQGKMVHPFLRRRRGEDIEYPHPKLEAILRRTLGVPLFQEQVMRLAMAVGGYTPGEADQLRRDMGSWRADGRMERHRTRLLEGMRKNGLSPEFAERVFQQIQGFGSYGFPESHAAAFAHLAYVSAYLKCHFPLELTCALLNAQPMGFYSPAVLVSDLKRHGVDVLPVDVQHSHWDCTLDNRSLRLGLRQVRGLGEAAGRAIERAREAGQFHSIEDIANRAALPSRTLVPLAAAGALASLHGRREAMWKASGTARPLGALFANTADRTDTPRLPELGVAEALSLDAAYVGAFAHQHPMELSRAALAKRGVLRACDLALAKPNRTVTVAGLVITRQRPESAGGAVFLTLEDETGLADVAFSSEMFLRFQEVIRFSGALVIRGRLRADGAARNVAAASVATLTLESDARVSSHDFH